jgi:hypothetical protein
MGNSYTAVGELRDFFSLPKGSVDWARLRLDHALR